MEFGGHVAIVAVEGTLLATVMGAALASHGWSTELVDAVPPALGWPAGGPTVVIVEDDAGRVRVMPPPQRALHEFVCIGSVRSLAALIALAARGATTLNQSTPIALLLMLVERALLGVPARRSDAIRGKRLAGMLQRQSEAVMLGRLTPAENQVLRGMVDGLSAGEIAARSHHSVHTIRSQIKSILVKLDVRSQIAAVALARRAAAVDDWFGVAQATFTNFGDDPT